MKIGLSTYTYRARRANGYVYVDKTALVHKLLDEDRCYFLARPRRFGKSLLLSTLASYFEGDEAAFKGTEMERLHTGPWESYPILRVDFGSMLDHQAGLIDIWLGSTLTDWEADYHLPEDPGRPLDKRFQRVIEAADDQGGNRGVVVLIDEYDKPITTLMNQKKGYADAQATLKSFYTVVKSCDAHLRFAMLTGVTRFSKMGVFSGLNNLNDISMTPSYATICGFTEAELRGTLGPAVEKLAGDMGVSLDECYAALKERYDGYRFSEKSENLYNPFSVLKAFIDESAEDYWHETGTPTFLVDALRDNEASYDLQHDLFKPISRADLNAVDSYKTDPRPLLFQAGYLTLDQYDADLRLFTLRIPNTEVKCGLLTMMAGRYVVPGGDGNGKDDFLGAPNIALLKTGRPHKFLAKLKALFDAEPYVLKLTKTFERDFQNCLYIIFQLMGLYAEVEQTTRRGRVDISVLTSEFVYLIELKLNDTAEAALAQMVDKGYSDRYALDRRTVYQLGLGFSSASKTIDSYLVANRQGAIVPPPEEEEGEL